MGNLLVNFSDKTLHMLYTKNLLYYCCFDYFLENKKVLLIY